ncbi:uncharacterized protein LOC124706690 [Lolium rigidum]|uniref:uncharacterized protein LOC124706690 n=1 Tax=Lolium rigidum TaxID=89674 RepID=UPI001F5D82BD|nr:uncharacterized protein LOC124706690 [Lolium rigidum]
MMIDGQSEGFTDLLIRLFGPGIEFTPDWFPSFPIHSSETSARTSPSSLGSDLSEGSSVPEDAGFGEDGVCSNEPIPDAVESPPSAEWLGSSPELHNESPLPADTHMPTSTESPPSERTWKQRFRRGEIPDSRPASSGRKSALEKAMRRCRDKHSDAIIEPELGMEFDSLPEAFDFYNIYSWEIGSGY